MIGTVPRRLVYYLDAAGYGGAVKYVERLVARADPVEFKIALVSPDAPGFTQFREAMTPFQVEWISLPVQNPRVATAYHALASLHQRTGPVARSGRLPGIREAGKTLLGVLGLLVQTRRLRQVDRILRAARPDILHVNLDRFPDDTGKLALFLGHAVGASAVLATLHRPAQRPVFPQWLHHHFDRRALRAADNLIVVARQQERELVDWYGAPPNSMRVIPNGASSQCFAIRASRLKRDTLGFEVGDCLVVHVGSVTPWRGQLVLAAALASLRVSCPLLRAAFVGEVFDRAYHSSLSQLLGGQPASPFRYFGHRPDALEFMRLADIAVVSSFEEGHSFALIEAMALGKAIVATDLESNAESLALGEAGLIVPAGDSGAMAEAIKKLYHDPGLRARLGEAARARASHLYTEERMVQATQSAYRRLLSDAA